MFLCILLFVGVLMMKKNGFISISIIYSFFLMFLIFLALIMSSYINTRTRLNIYKNDIKKSYSVAQNPLFNKIKDASNIYKITESSKIKSYRYTGSDPNNYISFNGETWRIIGAICKNSNCTAATDYVIKIVRTTTVKSAWDCKKNNIGSSKSDKGSYDWKDSQLMILLNPLASVAGCTRDVYSVKDANGVVIYPYMSAYLNNDLPLLKLALTDANGFSNLNTFTKCTSSITSNCMRTISAKSYAMMEQFTHNVYALKFDDIGTKKIDELEKAGTRNWSGYVSLLYASDICFSFKDNTDRTNCLKNSSFADSSSWLKSPNGEWLLNATTDKKVMVKTTKFESTDNLCAEKVIRPVVYLKGNITVSGNNNGSSSQPFILGEA